MPIVTLYHDDMPIDLALKYNGFLNEKSCDSIHKICNFDYAKI